MPNSVFAHGIKLALFALIVAILTHNLLWVILADQLTRIIDRLVADLANTENRR